MSKDLRNETLSLMVSDTYPDARQQPVLNALTTFLNSSSYTNIVSVAIKNQKQSDVVSIATIPSLINIIVSCTTLIDFSKTLQTTDMKYIIYGILYNFIQAEDDQFFDEINIDVFRKLYCGVFDVLLLSPKIITIAKSSCGC